MTPLDKRLTELEGMDESIHFKHRPRREWKKEEIQNKILLWQVPRHTGKILHALVSRVKPKTILELGTSGGYSGLWMLKAAPKATLHTIEWSPYRLEIAKESFAQAEVAHQVVHYNDKIRNILPTWTEMVDFVFIDADKMSYLENFKSIEKFLNPGAIVVVDNMLDSREKTDNLLEYVRKQRYASDLLPFDNGILIVYL